MFLAVTLKLHFPFSKHAVDCCWLMTVYWLEFMQNHKKIMKLQPKEIRHLKGAQGRAAALLHPK